MAIEKVREYFKAYNMENRILKHLKNEGYLRTFSLMENGTVRFLRFDITPDHTM